MMKLAQIFVLPLIASCAPLPPPSTADEPAEGGEPPAAGLSCDPEQWANREYPERSAPGVALVHQEIGDLNGDGLPEVAVNVEPAAKHRVPQLAILSPTNDDSCFRALYKGLGMYDSVGIASTKTQDWSDVLLLFRLPIRGPRVALGGVVLARNGDHYQWFTPVSCKVMDGNGQEVQISEDTCYAALAESDPNQPTTMKLPDATTEADAVDEPQEPVSRATAQYEQCSDRAECKTACTDGRASACRLLGESLRDEAPKSAVEALSLFKKGCEGGDGMACNDYASALYFGEGTGKNLKAAEQTGSKACDLLRAEVDRLTTGKASGGEIMLAQQQADNACANHHGFQCSAAAFSPSNRQAGKDALCRDLGFGGRAWGAIADCSGALSAAARCQTSYDHDVVCCP